MAISLSRMYSSPKKGIGCPCTLVDRKPTHTDRYLPFHSHHDQRMLTGVMQCMCNRAHQIWEDTNKQKELDQQEEVFIANGYPVRTVKRTFFSTARNREKDTKQDPVKPMFLYTLCQRSEREGGESMCTTRCEDHL